jgi:hypothetical protein
MQRKRGFTRVPWWDHDPSLTIVLTYIATFNLPCVVSTSLASTSYMV